jgi:hypothetical protein
VRNVDDRELSEERVDEVTDDSVGGEGVSISSETSVDSGGYSRSGSSMSLWAEASLCGLEAAWTCARVLSKISNPSSRSDPVNSELASLSDETGVLGGVAVTGYVSDECTSLVDNAGDRGDSEDDSLAGRGRFVAQMGEYRFRNPRGSLEKLLPVDPGLLSRECAGETGKLGKLAG